jgi:hypothetical protein
MDSLTTALEQIAAVALADHGKGRASGSTAAADPGIVSSPDYYRAKEAKAAAAFTPAGHFALMSWLGALVDVPHDASYTDKHGKKRPTYSNAGALAIVEAIEEALAQ